MSFYLYAINACLAHHLLHRSLCLFAPPLSVSVCTTTAFCVCLHHRHPDACRSPVFVCSATMPLHATNACINLALCCLITPSSLVLHLLHIRSVCLFAPCPSHLIKIPSTCVCICQCCIPPFFTYVHLLPHMPQYAPLSLSLSLLCLFAPGRMNITHPLCFFL